jgi:hypothetical protein
LTFDVRRRTRDRETAGRRTRGMETPKVEEGSTFDV